MTTFYVEIRIGNIAMSKKPDVQEALRNVIGQLNSQYCGSIRDVNGNTVGEFGYKD